MYLKRGRAFSRQFWPWFRSDKLQPCGADGPWAAARRSRNRAQAHHPGGDLPPNVPATDRRHAPRPSEDIAAESRRPSLMPYPVHGAPHPLRPGQFQGRLQRCPLSVTSPLRGLAPRRLGQAATGWHWADSDRDGSPAWVKCPRVALDEHQTPLPGTGEILYLPRIDTPPRRRHVEPKPGKCYLLSGGIPGNQESQ